MRRAGVLVVGIVTCFALSLGTAVGQWSCDAATEISLPYETSVCTCDYGCAGEADPWAVCGFWFRFEINQPSSVLFEVEFPDFVTVMGLEDCWLQADLWAGCDEGSAVEAVEHEVLSAGYCDNNPPYRAVLSFRTELDPGTYYFTVSTIGREAFYWPPYYNSGAKVSISPEILVADVDIIPPRLNPINRGVVPVAVLGSENLDISQIDVATLRFGPADATCKHDLTDEWTYNEHVEDVSLDGSMDLMLHFKTQETGIVCDDTEATLIGSLLDGSQFEGADTFETVGCNSNRPPRGANHRETERVQHERSPRKSEEKKHPGDLVEAQRVD